MFLFYVIYTDIFILLKLTLKIKGVFKYIVAIMRYCMRNLKNKQENTFFYLLIKILSNCEGLGFVRVLSCSQLNPPLKQALYKYMFITCPNMPSVR